MDKNNLCMYSLAGHVGMYCIVLCIVLSRGEKESNRNDVKSRN